jgi:hypothetical protein
MDLMSLLKHYRAAFLWGFLFGTVGLFAIAVLSLIFAPFEILAAPVLQPGKWMAAVLARDGNAGTGTIILLYLFTGCFYGIVGVAVQIALHSLFHYRNVDHKI